LICHRSKRTAPIAIFIEAEAPRLDCVLPLKTSISLTILGSPRLILLVYPPKLEIPVGGTFPQSGTCTVTVKRIAFNGVNDAVNIEVSLDGRNAQFVTVSPSKASLPRGVDTLTFTVFVDPDAIPADGSVTAIVTATKDDPMVMVQATGSFSVVPVDAPMIANFSPPSAKVGDPVKVSGFFLKNVTQVEFGGGTVDFVDSRPGAVSPDQVDAIVPLGSVTGPILVRTSTADSTERCIRNLIF
jgi:hypothetical protein